jgi:hypothetical protein
MLLSVTDRSNQEEAAQNPLLRLMLYAKEVYRLPRACRAIRVLSGMAWLTINDEDIFLGRDEQVMVPVTKAGAIISALGNTPLIFEARSGCNR